MESGTRGVAVVVAAAATATGSRLTQVARRAARGQPRPAGLSVSRAISSVPSRGG